MAKYGHKRRTIANRIEMALQKAEETYGSQLEVEWVLLSPKTGRPKEDNPFVKTVFALDGGSKHTGFVYGTKYGVVLGIITDPNGYGLFNVPPFVRILQKTLKPDIIAVEGAFCPSSEALLITGALVGVLSLEKELSLIIVSPHRKASFAKEKTHTEKMKQGLQYLSRWFHTPPTDNFVPLQLWQHSISALGVAITALQKEADN